MEDFPEGSSTSTKGYKRDSFFQHSSGFQSIGFPFQPFSVAGQRSKTTAAEQSLKLKLIHTVYVSVSCFLFSIEGRQNSLKSPSTHEENLELRQLHKFWITLQLDNGICIQYTLGVLNWMSYCSARNYKQYKSKECFECQQNSLGMIPESLCSIPSSLKPKLIDRLI